LNIPQTGKTIMLLQPSSRIVFYGDSITDAGRNAEQNNNGGLGVGYAALCAASLLANFPDWELEIFNRGISGNRVYDLESRLEADVLSLKPTLVSVLIGINDTWRRYDSNLPSNIDEYEETYRRILTRLREECHCDFLILEPFLLHTQDDLHQWREDLDPRIQACRRIARDFGATYLPLDGVFAAAACRAPEKYWLPDGVHPSLAGHQLIAQHWLEAVLED
jgi:lysophospholipase L1-like esterase